MKLFQQKVELSLIPLKDLVVFPDMVVPFFVGRSRSVKAVENAMHHGRLVFLATQKQQTAEDPEASQIYDTGTVARILQMLKLPDGTIRLLVEGSERANIIRFYTDRDHFRVQIRPIKASLEAGAESSALMRTVLKEFSRFTALYKKVPQETVTGIEKAETPEKLVNMICANIPLAVQSKVKLLSEADTRQRLEALAAFLISECEVLEMQSRITTKVRKKLEKSQKDYFLQEQLKEIHRELGNEDEDPTGAKELETRLEAKGLPEEVLAKCLKEIKRLSRQQPMSPESAVLRTYLEWISDLPWTERAQENEDLARARDILDEDHYDLKKVKERVLDFLAVRLLNKGKLKSPILCFIGPPGTGKTSLGRSVARALGRKFIRISLGGVRDEAEIRGHRKTYVGALPGKIVQSMRKAGSRNPVFLLDEIDKMSSDFRGDPASALLEVLDPEQNGTFTDHYLEVPYDLSEVMFITTANSAHNIPFPLRDRMEVIQIPGYTDYEKTKIAQKFLIPKQLAENGLGEAAIKFQTPAILKIIHQYTMESGVRNLEREIAAVLRKIARKAIESGLTAGSPETGADFKLTVTPRRVADTLGPETFSEKKIFAETKPGLAYGLAWTELGGKMLSVEVAILQGKGTLILTGSLGDVMKESAQTALSYLRAHAEPLGLEPGFNLEKDIHIHVPEGAIPKDGPSAGITITVALCSAVSGRTIKQGRAMTGEITLTGRLLAVGGIKEKVLAAHRNKMSHVLLPEMNRKDIEEIPQEVRSALHFEFADTVTDALKLLFDPV
jgi:ATP-dependent Lon protease